MINQINSLNTEEEWKHKSIVYNIFKADLSNLLNNIKIAHNLYYLFNPFFVI